MAWYSLFKWFRCFRKIPYTNWVRWYRNHLYTLWFDSLTPEEQEAEERRLEELRVKREMEHQQTIRAFNMMTDFVNKHSPYYKAPRLF